MFKLANKYSVDRPILKCEHLRCTPESLGIVNDENKQNFFDIPKAARVIF